MENETNDGFQKLAKSFETLVSSVSRPVIEKIEPLYSLRDTVTKSYRDMEDISNTILRRHNDLDDRVQTLCDLCANFKSLRLNETEEKRDQYRDMLKQVTSLSELAQHTQVLSITSFYYSTNQ